MTKRRVPKAVDIFFGRVLQAHHISYTAVYYVISTKFETHLLVYFCQEQTELYCHASNHINCNKRANIPETST